MHSIRLLTGRFGVQVPGGAPRYSSPFDQEQTNRPVTAEAATGRSESSSESTGYYEVVADGIAEQYGDTHAASTAAAILSRDCPLVQVWYRTEKGWWDCVGTYRQPPRWAGAAVGHHHQVEDHTHMLAARYTTIEKHHD